MPVSLFLSAPRQQWPVTRSLKVAVKGKLTEQERASMLREKDLGLGIGTTNRHWGFLRQLTTWFASKHPIANLDYSVFIIEDDRDARTLRDTYTIDEGIALFSLAPWIGAQSMARRMVPGAKIIHDACFFVPLIAWYTGLRRDEICGLELTDISDEEGIWHFIIQDNETRRIKTTTSKRLCCCGLCIMP